MIVLQRSAHVPNATVVADHFDLSLADEVKDGALDHRFRRRRRVDLANEEVSKSGAFLEPGENPRDLTMQGAHAGLVGQVVKLESCLRLSLVVDSGGVARAEHVESSVRVVNEMVVMAPMGL